MPGKCIEDQRRYRQHHRLGRPPVAAAAAVAGASPVVDTDGETAAVEDEVPNASCEGLPMEAETVVMEDRRRRQQLHCHYLSQDRDGTLKDNHFVLASSTSPPRDHPTDSRCRSEIRLAECWLKVDDASSWTVAVAAIARLDSWVDVLRSIVVLSEVVAEVVDAELVLTAPSSFSREFPTQSTSVDSPDSEAHLANDRPCRNVLRLAGFARSLAAKSTRLMTARRPSHTVP